MYRSVRANHRAVNSGGRLWQIRFVEILPNHREGRSFDVSARKATSQSIPKGVARYSGLGSGTIARLLLYTPKNACITQALPV
jgi:hypothetical protein